MVARRGFRPRQLRRQQLHVAEARRRTTGVSVAILSMIGVLAGALIGLAGSYLSTSQQISHDAAMRVRAERRTACTDLYRLALTRERNLLDAVFADIEGLGTDAWVIRKRMAARAERNLKKDDKIGKDWDSVKTDLFLSGSDRSVRAVKKLENAVGMVHEAVGFDVAAVLHGAAGLRGQVDPHPQKTTMAFRFKRDAERSIWRARFALNRSLEGVLRSCQFDIGIER